MDFANTWAPGLNLTSPDSWHAPLVQALTATAPRADTVHECVRARAGEQQHTFPDPASTQLFCGCILLSSFPVVRTCLEVNTGRAQKRRSHAQGSCFITLEMWNLIKKKANWEKVETGRAEIVGARACWRIVARFVVLKLILCYQQLERDWWSHHTHAVSVKHALNWSFQANTHQPKFALSSLKCGFASDEWTFIENGQKWCTFNESRRQAWKWFQFGLHGNRRIDLWS